MSDKSEWVTAREFSQYQKLSTESLSQYQKAVDVQLQDIKVMLIRVDGKLDKLRTETIPNLQTGQATLSLKAKVLYGLLSIVTGGTGAAIIQALSGLF